MRIETTRVEKHKLTHSKDRLPTFVPDLSGTNALAYYTPQAATKKRDVLNWRQSFGSDCLEENSAVSMISKSFFSETFFCFVIDTVP